MTLSTVQGAAIDPLAFPSMGAFPAGSFTIDTDAMTVNGVGGGTVLAQGVNLPDVAVFTFHGGANIASTAVINVVGSRPTAILFKGPATIEGTFNVTAGGAAGGQPFVDLGAGFAHGLGKGGGIGSGNAGAGAGFGGTGGTALNANPGGATYGNLLAALEAGSGGGASGSFGTGIGGNGGGGIEIGALGTLTLDGAVIDAGGVNGGGSGGAFTSGAGGGSGGGIFVHAFDVSIVNASLLDATGGKGGNGNAGPGGGGGGGGRIAVLHNANGTFSNVSSTLFVAGGVLGLGSGGGPNGASGSPGSTTIASDAAVGIPEPSGAALLMGLVGIGMLKRRS